MWVYLSSQEDNNKMQSAQNPFPVGTKDPRPENVVSRHTTADVRDYARKGRKFVSMVQLIIGLASLLLGVLILTLLFPVDAFHCNSLHQTSVGIWYGMVLIITAVFGAYSTKKEFLMTLYLVLCTFTIVTSAACIIISAVTLSLCTNYGEESPTLTRNLYSLLAVACVAGVIASIFGASFTCNGLNCCKQAPTVIHYHYDGVQTGLPRHPVTPVNQPAEQIQSAVYYSIAKAPASNDVGGYFTVVSD